MGYFHKETKDCLKCVHKYIFSTIDFSCNMLMYIMYMFYKLILNEEIRFLWATTQLFCLSKSINWRNLIQYYSMQNAPNIHTVMHVLHLCAHLHKVFFYFFFLSRFDCSWLSISSAVGLVLLLDVKVLIFCLINKWIIMGPTHSVLWLNLFNLFTANGECWLWSNSGRHFNSRGLIDQSLLLIENRSQN